LLAASSVCENRFKCVPRLQQLDPDCAGEQLVSNGETDVSKLVGDRDDFRDLWLHRFHIAEGKSEETFKKVVLAQVVITLVLDLEKIPNLFRGFVIENVVMRGMAEGKEKLNLGLLVASAPILIGIRVSGGVGCRCSAINHVPESSMFKDQGNHLTPVGVVVPVVIEEWNLVLAMLKLWFSRCSRGGGSGIVGLCAGVRWRVGGVSMTAAGGTDIACGHRCKGMSRGNKALRVE